MSKAKSDLIQGADARPRLHLWPEDDGWRFSMGATGRRFEGDKELPHAAAIALYAFEDRLLGGAVIIIERSPLATYGKEDETHD